MPGGSSHQDHVRSESRSPGPDRRRTPAVQLDRRRTVSRRDKADTPIACGSEAIGLESPTAGRLKDDSRVDPLDQLLDDGSPTSVMRKLHDRGPKGRLALKDLRHPFILKITEEQNAAL